MPQAEFRVSRFEFRMSRTALALLLLLSAATTNAQTPPAGRERPIQHLIIVSIDGLLPSCYTNPDAHGLKVPTLRELARNGAWSPGARGVVPTVTYPSHTSMATGANPGTHGIVANGPWDPLRKADGALRFYTEDIRVPTLWDVARAAGLRTGLVYWPVTVGARATAIVPEFWREDATAEDQKLQRAMSTPGLLEAVAARFPGFWDRFLPPRVRDEAAGDIAVHIIETVRPELLMVHMFDVDHWQHNRGPFSPEAKEMVETADRQLARIIEAAKTAGIWERTALAVVSDHGFSPYTQRVRPGVLLRDESLVTLDNSGRVTGWKAWLLAGGGYAYVYVKDPADEKTKHLLLNIFQSRAGRSGTGIGRLMTRPQIAADGGDPNAFLWMEAAEDFGITGGYTGDYISQVGFAAQHGQHPARPEMHTSMLFYGPSIEPGRIEGARLIDLAPTVAPWLGLRMEKAEGKPLPVKLRAPAH